MIYVPTIRDRNNPKFWHSRKPVKWIDEEGVRHKTHVTPIKYLSTKHLFNILMKQKGPLNEIEDTQLYHQIMNVATEYKRRLK